MIIRKRLADQEQRLSTLFDLISQHIDETDKFRASSTEVIDVLAQHTADLEQRISNLECNAEEQT